MKKGTLAIFVNEARARSLTKIRAERR